MRREIFEFIMDLIGAASLVLILFGCLWAGELLMLNG
jgi:hypothetical protein